MLKFLENVIYYSLKWLGLCIRRLPLRASLRVGRLLGGLAYYLDERHRALAYANLRRAFAGDKSAKEIRRMTRQLFENFGQNCIDVLRLPLLNRKTFQKLVDIEGREHIDRALQKGRGVILLAMHFGSWELASLSCAMLGHPYKVMVKPQDKFSRLDQLLNELRSCGGSIVLSRGMGTREMLRSLKNNEINAMVVDQGGRDGVLVKFFGRTASLSDGAIRLALKYDIPICFVIILRQKDGRHRLILHPPLEFERTDDPDQDVRVHLGKVVHIMEDYIRRSPAEYTWFYKIWKYSRESTLLILHDGRTGHLRQSQAAALALTQALSERNITAATIIVDVHFNSGLSRRVVSLGAALLPGRFWQGRLGILKKFIQTENVQQLESTPADFIISTGSATAALNYLWAREYLAKSIVLLKPGLMGLRKFDLKILPEHDRPRKYVNRKRILFTRGALNLITSQYLEEQSDQLKKRYSHLSPRHRLTIGLLIGGSGRHFVFSLSSLKIMVNQLLEVTEALNAEILATTSRRTPPEIEQLLKRDLKRSPRCTLLILASQNDVPEAVGGILGLSDILVVSADSISMISEAASSGKDTIVFPLTEKKSLWPRRNKHQVFTDHLQRDGHIITAPVKHIDEAIYNVARNKAHTRRLDDQGIVLEAMRQII